MKDHITGKEVTDFGWALTDMVRVTLTDMDPDLISATYLVERLGSISTTSNFPGSRALVLQFRENLVLINGRYMDLGDDLPRWCGITDAVTMSPNLVIGDFAVVQAGE